GSPTCTTVLPPRCAVLRSPLSTPVMAASRIALRFSSSGLNRLSGGATSADCGATGGAAVAAGAATIPAASNAADATATIVLRTAPPLFLGRRARWVASAPDVARQDRAAVRVAEPPPFHAVVALGQSAQQPHPAESFRFAHFMSVFRRGARKQKAPVESPGPSALKQSVFVRVRSGRGLCDLHEELGVGLVLLELAKQQLRGGLGLETREHAAQLPHDLELFGADEDFLAARAGGVDVNRGEDAA